MGSLGTCLVFFGIVVLMRWLVIALLVSVLALLLVAGAMARHVWRHRRLLAEDAANLEGQRAQNREFDLAPDLQEPSELVGSAKLKDASPNIH
jgi:hypothetical protein